MRLLLATALTAAAITVASPVRPTGRLRPGSLTRSPGAPAAATPGRWRTRKHPDFSRRGAAGLLGVCVALLVGGMVGLVAGAAVAGVANRVLGRLEPAAARKRRERMAAELPTALDLLAGCLAAGRPPTEALAAVTAALAGPVADELTVVSTRLSLGGDPVSVWLGLTAHPVLGPLGRTMVRALETGAPVADALSRLVEDRRRQRRWDAEQRARSVGVQAAGPLAVCFLPAFIAVGIVPTIAGAFGRLVG